MRSVTDEHVASSRNNLAAEDLAMFDHLRIPEGLLALNQIRRVTDFAARNDFGITGDGDMSGIVFPYLDLSGTHRWTCRLRRDHPEMESGKPAKKYVSPFGDVRHLFFPPGSDGMLEHPETAIVLVEAEKSALAITAWANRTGEKVLAIAMGGAWNFRGRVGKTVDASGARVNELGVLADLRVCAGRSCLVMLDSNVATNPHVKKAQRTLVRELKTIKAGALRVINLPVEPGTNGPDDFLAAHNDEAFAKLLASQSSEDDEAPDRPVVVYRPGNAPIVVDRAEKILLDHALDLKMFQRGGEIVRIVALPETREEGCLSLSAGSVIVEPITRTMLQEIFDRLISFQKIDEEGVPHSTDCPTKIADFYLSRTGSRRLPILTGMIFAPVMLDDGTVLGKPGYDASTGLYFISNENWLEIPREPTIDDAKEALGVLLEPFAEFPWCEPADWATHLAGIITAIQRRLLPTAPLIGYKAPERRTGKSLLAESLAIISTGRPAPATVASGDHEEFRKAVMAALYRGAPIINLDNVETVLGSSSLCIALTQETYEDRILGESRTMQLPTRTLWTCTGNNLTFKGDLTVRALLCSIDAASEHPEERNFKIADLRQFLLQHRAELVRAALTILRAYYVAGRPRQDVRPWGGFDVWSRTIREAVVWAGLPDPAKTREGITDNDPDREAAIALLHALREVFRDAMFTLKRAVDFAQEPGNSILLDALKTVAGRKGDIDRRTLGWWCRRYKDRIIGGMRLCSVGKEHAAVQWKVEVKEVSNV